MNQDSILKFEQITFAYPAAKNPVMRDFNLEINSGTVTAVLGPNGAGKTTFLHLALGWLKPLSGQIFLAQRNLTGFTRRDLGHWMRLVPQSEHISFEFSLLEFVLLGRAPHLSPLAMPGEEDIEIALSALRQVGMADLYGRSMLGLSGGELQLVLVARALAQQPRLLFLDEPTSHLDLANKGRLVHLLRDLSAQGVTILFTTHEPEVASAFASHLVLVKKGQVIKTGKLEEVFTSQNLTDLYQLPVTVETVTGRRIALWN